ncbi:MAG: nucleotidyltransferase domain-containing protein [Nitrososphaerota archaeon]|nr:nucleotidyltransferase domain-containing protein [Candidatus Bathyarchaeota archaeon]MDW8062221.1 nucleotidyltransferase domain-containing protein [Nitrososphaerota archaeon]
MEVYSEITKRVEELAFEEGAEAVRAAILYGSRVSGYAREDSDYDVIAIMDRLPERIQYHYKPFGDVKLAILAVDREIFESDVKDSLLGDFVSGRLFTPFIPLSGSDYVKAWEVSMKRRVALEELIELAYLYEPVLDYLLVEPTYIVVNYLKKRARAYPPVGYSYRLMLSGVKGEDNLKIIMNGLYEALKLLESDGYVKLLDRFIRLDRSILSRTDSRGYVFKKMGGSIVKAVKSYAVHTYAGREVFLRVFLEEFASKLLRSYRASSFKLNTRGYISLPTHTGIQAIDRGVALTSILKELGFEKPRVKRIGHLLSLAYLIEDDGRKITIKMYGKFDLAKWLPVSLWSQLAVDFEVKPRRRLLNEYLGFMRFSERGLPYTPIIYLDLRRLYMVREYVPGDTLTSILRRRSGEVGGIYRLLGSLLGRVHSLGYRLGDVKPSNILLGSDGRLYILDLEQFKESNQGLGWDIAELLYLTGVELSGGKSIKLLEELVDCLIDGYIAGGGSIHILEDASSLKYYGVFAPLIPLESSFIAKKLRDRSYS